MQQADEQVVQQWPRVQNTEKTRNGCTSFLNGLFCSFCVLTGQFFVDSTTLQLPNDLPEGGAGQEGG